MEFYKFLNSSRKIHFYACRILQFTFDGNSAELSELLTKLTKDQIIHSEIRMCLKIIEAINTTNYEYVLVLSKMCPSEYIKTIIGMFISLIRVSVLNLMAQTLTKKTGTKKKDGHFEIDFRV